MSTSFTQNVEEVFSTTLPQFMPGVIDNTFRSIPVMVKLIENDRIMFEGGSEIRQAFAYDESPSGWYAGQEVLDTNARDNITAMRFDWKFAYASVNLPMTEILMNSGASAVTSLVTSKMQNAEITLRQRLASSLFSDGTAFGGKEFVGLKQAVHDTGSYGGLARTSTEGAKLISWVDATGGTVSLAMIQKALGKATIAPESPDLIVTTQRQYDIVWGLVQANQRFIAGQAPGLLGQCGFGGININGAMMVVDQSCPAGEMYLLNSKWIKFVMHSNRVFSVEGPFPVANQDTKVWRIHVACALVVQSPKLCSKISGLTE